MSPKAKGIAVGAACAALGAIAGIAGAAAAPSSQKSSTTSPQKPPALRWQLGRAGGPPGVPPAGGGPAVHEDAIVLNRAGTAFIHATEDVGTVVSVNADKLTIKEGIGKVTYKTVILTIPSSATVVRNFAKATLSALRPGDRVRVIQSSDGTSVFADNGTPPPVPGPGLSHGPRGFGRAWGGRPAGAPGAPGSGAGVAPGSGSSGSSGSGPAAGPAGPPPLGA